MWDAFIAAAKSAGHEVVCVTMRYSDQTVRMPCEVVYTGCRAKMLHMGELQRIPDVWIDDMPHRIFQGAQ
jgi:hypothetical protein